MADRTEYDRDLQRMEEDDEALLRVARARFHAIEEAEDEYRREATLALEFIDGEQWPREIKAQRERDKRPCLTINRIIQHVHNITNEARQNPPAIKVSPVDDFGDIEKAKVRQGMIRHIEVSSNADIAYDTALEAAVIHGRGWFMYRTEFEDPTSFNQVITCERILDALRVYPDPHCQDPVYEDMQYCFLVGEMSRDLFREQWPDKEPSLQGLETRGDGWIHTNTVRVAEYWYIVRTPLTLGQLADGRAVPVGRVDGAPGQYQTLDPMDNPEGLPIVRTRQSVVPQVKWCKMNGYQVLERTDWPGRWIPLVPVMGEERIINGKVVRHGIVKPAMDSQRMYNFMAAAEAETIGLSPRVPHIAAEGQIAGYERQWQTANTVNHSVLIYKPQALNGQPVPPPQRNVFEPATQAITNARMLAADDLKSTTGIFDPALGNQSNETSGKAINARKMQSNTATFHYPNNRVRSIRHGARILLDLMPYVYDTARVARIIGDDNEAELVPLNQPFVNPKTGMDDWHDMRVGRYDVVVTAGTSFQTKRQEALESMTEIIQAVPDSFAAMGDVWAKNMDFPGAEIVAERFRKMMPPQLQDQADPNDPKARQQALEQMVPELQKQVEALNAFGQQAEQQIAQLTQENESLKAREAIQKEQLVLESRRLDFDKQIELLRLELERMKIEGDLAIKQQQIQVSEEKNDLQAMGMQQQAELAATAATQEGETDAS